MQQLPTSKLNPTGVGRPSAHLFLTVCSSSLIYLQYITMQVPPTEEELRNIIQGPGDVEWR